MTVTADEIEIAQRRATAARARLSGSIELLQAKLKPKVLARDAARSVADAGQDAARTGLQAVRSHPAPMAGAVALIGLFLARHRLAALFHRIAKEKTKSSSERRKSA